MKILIKNSLFRKNHSTGIKRDFNEGILKEEY